MKNPGRKAGEENRDIARLRSEAEARLNERKAGLSTPLAGVKGRGLRHELSVHYAELEIQNEELKNARHETEAALARFTEVFDFAPLGYAVLSADGIIREINHAGARLLGAERARLVGHSFGEFLRARHIQSFFAVLESVCHSSDRSHTSETELASKGLEAVPLRITAAAVGQERQTILLAFESIAEQKRREAVLADTERALQEANRRKDEFLAMLSHELRNPLAPIRNSLHLLKHGESGGDQAKKAMAIIDRQVSHITHLVNDLLDVSRIASGKIRLQRQVIDLAQIARSAVEDSQRIFDAAGIRLETQIPERPFFVHADAARMTQVLSNLLGNAEKFSNRGERAIVSVAEQRGKVALIVSDSGTGIPHDLLSRLCEPFAQAPQTIERSRGGLGLGLAMVKGIAEMHGGSMTIESEGLGRGTRVTVLLEPAESLEEAPDATATEASSTPRRVLVIEDNPDMAESLCAVLSLYGHEVVVAGDGRRALRVAAQFHPNVVLCDIGLPEMDGYAVARAFRADASLRGAYLVALTGYALPADVRRSKEAGFDEHLGKPVAPSEIARLLTHVPTVAA
ncbi:MAG: ATP-binding protein [Myxococcota bacterium]|nr:ATP-binding protein [Myxococcota bacterium]